MKLKLRREETRSGIIKKKTEYELWVSAKLDDEEKAIYGSCKESIENYIVAMYEYRGLELNLKVRDLLDEKYEFRMAFPDLAQLARKEAEVKEGAKAVSTYLKQAANAGAGTGEEEIEL